MVRRLPQQTSTELNAGEPCGLRPLAQREEAMRTDPAGHASIAVEHNRLLIRVEGEIDVDAAPLVRSCADAALATTSAEPVVIDLTDCSFMDSSGLNALVFAAHTASRRGRHLRITGAHGVVLRVMQLTDLDRTLPLEL